jgi:hypothetical protein
MTAILPQKSLDELIDEMNKMADLLVPYHMPLTTKDVEDDISILKNREGVVDGYNLLFNFSKIKYFDKDDNFLYLITSLQIHGLYFPILSFDLVLNIGKKFFKDADNVCYVTFEAYNKRFYGWFVSNDGEKFIAPKNTDVSILCEIDGFKYYKFNPEQINFY